MGNISWHHSLNDVAHRALISANISNILDHHCLNRVDGKRPDGLTLLQRGRRLIWDAICVDTFSTSHLKASISLPRAAVEVEILKLFKYLFLPFAMQISEIWGSETVTFGKKLYALLNETSSNPRSGYFFKQRTSMAIQCCTAASLMGTFGVTIKRNINFFSVIILLQRIFYM